MFLNLVSETKRKGSLIARYGMVMEVDAGFRGVDGRYREVYKVGIGNCRVGIGKYRDGIVWV